ncbi:hypothetical protein D3C72_1938910 [compost metagenome]
MAFDQLNGIVGSAIDHSVRKFAMLAEIVARRSQVPNRQAAISYRLVAKHPPKGQETIGCASRHE